MKNGILLFAHGSPDPEWATPFRSILARVRESNRARPVELAFLDAAPNFATGIAALIASGATQITVIPLFLARGGHLKRDLPLLVEAAEALHGVRISSASAIGESEAMIDAISAWVRVQS